MNVLKLVFLATVCFKVAIRSVKNLKAIVFLVDPYYYILLYLMIRFVWKFIVLLLAFTSWLQFL